MARALGVYACILLEHIYLHMTRMICIYACTWLEYVCAHNVGSVYDYIEMIHAKYHDINVPHVDAYLCKCQGGYKMSHTTIIASSRVEACSRAYSLSPKQGI